MRPLIVVTLAALALAGCSNEPAPDDRPRGGKFPPLAASEMLPEGSVTLENCRIVTHNPGSPVELSYATVDLTLNTPAGPPRIYKIAINVLDLGGKPIGVITPEYVGVPSGSQFQASPSGDQNVPDAIPPGPAVCTLVSATHKPAP